MHLIFENVERNIIVKHNEANVGRNDGRKIERCCAEEAGDGGKTMRVCFCH